MTRFPALVYCSVADVHVRIQVSQACWLLAVGMRELPDTACSCVWPCGGEPELMGRDCAWDLGETGVFLSWRECPLLVGAGPLLHLSQKGVWTGISLLLHVHTLWEGTVCPLVYILTRAGRLAQSKLVCYSFSFLIVCHSFYLLIDTMGLVGWVQYSLLHHQERAPVSFWGDLSLADGLFYLVYLNSILLFWLIYVCYWPVNLILPLMLRANNLVL